MQVLWQKTPKGQKINAQHMEQNAKRGGKPNHSAAKCKSKIRRSKVHYTEDDETNSDNDYRISTVIHHIGALNAKTSKKNMIPKQLFASMKVNDKVNIKFQLDVEQHVILFH